MEEETLQVRDRPGVYAGGDIVRGAGTVVEAVADGRRATRSIHARFMRRKTSMSQKDQLKLVQDYVNLLGKTYIILLSSLDDFFGAPLSTNEKLVLQVLDEKPISIKEISLRTGLALSTLTNVFDKMEDKKLVRRRHSRTDRRMVKIEMEVAGRRLKSKFNNLIKQVSSTFLAMLSEEDRKNFTSALEITGQAMAVEGGQIQDVLGSLIEPMKMTLDTEFKKK